MKEYPKELLPQPKLKRIESSSILENGFIREVESDIYPLLEQEAVEPDFFVELIIGNKSSKKEVFELSLFLYGIFNEEHIGIFVNSDYAYIDWNFLDDVPGDIEFNIRERYPLFLKADALYLQNITFLDKMLIKKETVFFLMSIDRILLIIGISSCLQKKITNG